MESGNRSGLDETVFGRHTLCSGTNVDRQHTFAPRLIQYGHPCPERLGRAAEVLDKRITILSQ